MTPAPELVETVKDILRDHQMSVAVPLIIPIIESALLREMECPRDTEAGIRILEAGQQELKLHGPYVGSIWFAMLRAVARERGLLEGE